MTFRDFWDQDAAKFLQDRWQRKASARFDQRETQRVLLRVMQGCRGTLLDIGCGPGFWLRQQNLCAHFATRLGVDCSPAMVQEARAAGVEAIVADAHALPFEDCSVDMVISVHVLEYSEDPGRFLKETQRVLRPGGRCCLITKNASGLLWQWAREFSERIAPNPLTFHCFSPEKIARLWGTAPLACFWISARLITDLNDVNDAVHVALPGSLEWVLLWGSIVLQPLLRQAFLGRWLAWHVGFLLEKEGEPH